VVKKQKAGRDYQGGGSGLPKALFRFFDKEQHAFRLLEGFVWISTLHHCRHAEDIRRADPGEGTLTWALDDLDTVIPPGNPELRREAFANFGFHLDEPDTNTIGGITFVRQAPDAYLLALTKNRKLTGYGRYAVKISDPRGFLDAVNRAMFAKFGPLRCLGHYMSYGPREFDNVRPTNPVPAVFIGPRENAREEEFRMLWPREGPPLERFELRVPEAEKFCSMAN